MTKKILLISYHFPPGAAVGGLRIANFARRLPDHGWQPSTLTVKDKYLESVDPGKLKGLDQTKIHKAGLTPTLSQAYLAGKKLAQRVRPTTNAPPSTSGRTALATAKPGASVETLPMRLRRYVLSFLALPDAQRNWVVPATTRAIRIVRQKKIGFILTSCPPYSVHLVGLLTKWLTGVRWIADFRDPWMTTGTKTMYSTCAASLAVERWMERAVVRNADRVIANTEMLCDGLRKAHSSISPDRFVCITNGFDREFFSNFSHLDKETVFSITYTGSLYFGRTPEPVLQAVEELIREGSINESQIRVRLVGQCQSVEGRPITQLIGRYRLGAVVEVLEPVSYERAIEMIRQSHLALLLAPNQPYQIPAKVYDYMGVGTRVLALAGEGATANLVRTTGIGAAFDPADIAGIKEFIRRSKEEDDSSARAEDAGAMNAFSLDSIAGRLADELNRLCAVDTATEAVSRVPDGRSR